MLLHKLKKVPRLGRGLEHKDSRNCVGGDAALTLLHDDSMAQISGGVIKEDCLMRFH